jgi:hypothetical protein
MNRNVNSKAVGKASPAKAEGTPKAGTKAGSSLNPVFPDEVLVGSIGDLARELAAGTEVPVEFLFAAGLTMLGACAGTGLTLAAAMPVEPRLYTVLLGESYSVKKSTALKRVIDLFGSLARASRILRQVPC